jgi:hypothetical protein
MKPSNNNTQPIERDIEAGNAEQGAPTASTEQAADLAALQAMATGADAGAPAVIEEEQGPTLQEEIAAAMGMAVSMLGPIFPSLKGIYTAETMGAASGAIAAVCDKHGWLSGGLMGKYGEEIACLAIVGPLGFATYQGVRADLAEMAKKRPIDATAKQDGIDLGAPLPVIDPKAGERKGPAVTFGSAPA